MSQRKAAYLPFTMAYPQQYVLDPQIIGTEDAKRCDEACKYEAIDLNRFQFQPKPFKGNLGILCHLRPRKRVYEAILAFSELCQGRDDLHFHIGGGGAEGFHEYPIALRELVENLGLQEKITFYGNVTDNAAWYKEIDLFISNGYSEGWQVSLIESMASGCYSVVHRWPGADELLPAENLYFGMIPFQ